QLADRLFVSHSSIANWETGRRIPDLTILARLAQILGVDISVLAGAVAENPPSPDVIIIDDEPIILAGTIPVLEQAMPQATITGFARPSEALDFCRRNRVYIAFLDINLGKTSGIDLCRQIMNINPLTNVIFLTSYPDYAMKAWDTAASGFLVKPLKTEDVSEQPEKLRFPVNGL
ncbi:MAG: response regulator, partial [Lachnospiraceae bacterium]|nr:response regulator [Lachnospiraceae bacterium]